MVVKHFRYPTAVVDKLAEYEELYLPQPALGELYYGAYRSGRLERVAQALLLARLGLRAGEVIRLLIEDIDWSQGCVRIRAGKTHRERSLPLCQEVGDALVAYLKKARPTSSHRELFLRWRPPFRPLRSSVSICTLIQKLLRRAGVSVLCYAIVWRRKWSWEAALSKRSPMCWAISR